MFVRFGLLCLLDLQYGYLDPVTEDRNSQCKFAVRVRCYGSPARIFQRLDLYQTPLSEVPPKAAAAAHTTKAAAGVAGVLIGVIIGC